ncbi:hypothetical protein KI387_003259 [Taxus chinensis]|uniref:Uncharacterized protein n=1 Tax=Taxus chinensis TaxID=29808 RepID=A0AA38GYT7_TAXCH|nr:hypothetical protein KI387_003259 [Taxus chinensis]
MMAGERGEQEKGGPWEECASRVRRGAGLAVAGLMLTSRNCQVLGAPARVGLELSMPLNAFKVDKEVAGAVKLAFSNLDFLPASTITYIFNINDNACRRVSIKPNEKDFAIFNNLVGFDDLSFESEAQIQGEQQTDSDLKNNTHTIIVPQTCENQPKCPKSKKEFANEAGISEELIDLMLKRMKLLKENELVSLAMIVATRGLSAMLREENKEQGPNGECNSGSLGDILVKRVSRLEVKKIVASKVPREPKKKSSPKILPDLRSILVKHVSKLEREVQEARKLAKAMQSEDRDIVEG